MRRNGEDRETEELFRKFQGILNKLTPQKFVDLAEQALQLKIDNEEKLKGCIDKIFTKVRAEREGGRERERIEAGEEVRRKKMIEVSLTESLCTRKLSPNLKASFLIHLFSQALAEPIFSIAYANLSKVMSTIKVEVPTEPEGKIKVITFRRVLLTKCQREFEKDKRDDEEREKILNAIKETEDVSNRKYSIFMLNLCTPVYGYSLLEQAMGG